MRNSVSVFTLVCISFFFVGLILTGQSSAKLDLKTAAGIWLFDEEKGDVAKDLSGKSNNGKLQGPKWVKGKFGSALGFDGVDDRIVVPDANSLDLQKEWTITAWVFVNKSENGYGHIVGKRNDGLNVANYAFRTNNTGVSWESYFKFGGAWKGAWGQGAVKKDTWLYMTAVYDGSNTVTIYENGQNIGSAAIGPPPPADQAEVHIGGWQNNTSELIDGILDEVVILGAALTVDDMKNLMANGIEKALGITAVDYSGKLSATWGSIKGKF